MTGSARAAAATLRAHLLAMGPDVAVRDAAGTARFERGGRLFCLLRPLARRVDVGFTKLGRAAGAPRRAEDADAPAGASSARSPRILDARAARLPFVRHRVVVEAPGDLDAELRAWLREAYELAAE